MLIQDIVDVELEYCIYKTSQCEPVENRYISIPESIRQLHYNFSNYHSFSFLNILSTLFCRNEINSLCVYHAHILQSDSFDFLAHIRLAKYCTHVKMGLILSLVSSSLHVLILGNESRLADILCQTALKYTQSSIIHRQQYPLTLGSIPKTKQHPFIVAGSVCSVILLNAQICFLYLHTST